MLIKLDVSANTPDSEIGKILDRDSLLTRAYIEKALVQMKRVAGNENRNILSAKFCMILGKLVVWYRQIMQPGAITDQQAESLRPINAFGTQYKPEEIPSDPRHSGPGFVPESTIKAMAVNSMPNSAATFTSFSSFSGAPRYPTPGHSPFPSSFMATTNGPEMQTMSTHAPVNHGTPNSAADYSSPELMDQSGPRFDFSMDVEPSMFDQLQDADPFTYNQDPNEWMFEGMDYSNMPNVPDFDWNSIPGPQ